MRRLLFVSLGTMWMLMPALSSGACSVNTVPVNFGSYDVFSNSNLDTIGQVTVGCTGVGQTYSVSVKLNKGLNGSINQRRLRQTNGNDRLDYNLYIDAGRSSIWGDGTSGSSFQTVSVAGGSSSMLTIYGRAPALQDVTMGTYVDTVAVNIEF